MTHKTYEQILEEYEKFFSLEQEQSKKQSDDRVRGANIVNAVNVSFAEAIEGAQQIITYQRVLRCEGCKGNKVKELEDQKPCPRCFGSGEDKDTPGELCKACLGGGLESVICMDCGGDGLIDQQLSLMVKIPRSVETGMLLRVREKGHEALNGKPGDLIIKTNV